MCGGIGVGGAQKHISVAPCAPCEGVVAKPLTAEYRESMATFEVASGWQRGVFRGRFRRPLGIGSRSSNDQENTYTNRFEGAGVH